MEAQIKKGILEMCILYTVKNDRLYGYDIMKSMKRFFPEVNESTFYAILRRLHAENYTEISLGQESKGPPRKYYHITPAGRAYLNAGIQDWQRMRAIIAELGIE
jgi:PadR family transcriptional regulator PadR